MTRSVGKGLVLQWNTFYVMKRIPKDVKDQFEDKARFSHNLQTDDFATASTLAKPYLVKWKYLIAMARLKNKGHIIDLDEAADTHAQQFNVMGRTQLAAKVIAEKLNAPEEGITSEQRNDRIDVFARAAGRLTPFAKYVDQWIEDYGYTLAVGDEAKRYVQLRFSKKFEYFESISAEELKTYIKARMDGSDGDRAWSERSVEKNFSFVKQYWNWCLDNDLITEPNLIDLPRLMKRKNNTKSQRSKTKKDANHAYTVEECWQLHKAAEATDQRLADLIMLGMYTGCRINELASLKLEGVTEDRFLLEDTKTDAGDRGIPIHTDIQQMVETLKQTSTEGYLINGLSSNNATNDRSKGIGKRFGRLKRSLGFEDKKHTFHSFRSTLATRFLSAGVTELFAARVIGHAAGGMTYGMYAGDLEFDEKVKAMAKVNYDRAA